LKIAGLKIAIIVIALIIFLFPDTSAQDIHFTQIQATPLLLNPANTGVSDYDFRLVNNYRNQWRKIEAPYNTYSLSADKRLLPGSQAMGIGACFVHDLSSGNHFVADKFYFSVSYSRFYRNHQFVLGIQPGLIFRSFDQSDITFGSQFSISDSRFNPGLPSHESLLADKLSYFDCNAGFLWRARIKEYQVAAGVAVYHLNRPVESFMKSNEDEHLPLRYNVHGNILIPVTERIDLIPMILYCETSGAREFVGGSLLGYSVPSVVRSVKNLYALAFMRINPVRNLDAVMVGGGIRILKFDLFISYDVNISTLRKATNFYGAFEISLIYRNLHTRSKDTTEPCYML
jgi:type IX secretion system PorP/SprF family membrane protein